MVLANARVLIATLWAGSLWTVGYVVAPTLFATLFDRVLAGTIAGSLFGIEAWVSIFCAAVLLILVAFEKSAIEAKQRKALRIVIIAMLACSLLTHFGLQPYMAALREAAGPGGVMDSQARLRFGVLHGVSSAIFLVQSVLAALLVLRIR